MTDGFDALYLFLLAATAGYMLIARVASLMHLSLLSGSNFVHGVVWAGAYLSFQHADGGWQLGLSALAIAAATANLVGAYLTTDRSLAALRRRADDERIDR